MTSSAGTSEGIGGCPWECVDMVGRDSRVVEFSCVRLSSKWMGREWRTHCDCLRSIYQAASKHFPWSFCFTSQHCERQARRLCIRTFTWAAHVVTSPAWIMWLAVTLFVAPLVHLGERLNIASNSGFVRISDFREVVPPIFSFLEAVKPEHVRFCFRVLVLDGDEVSDSIAKSAAISITFGSYRTYRTDPRGISSNMVAF